MFITVETQHSLYNIFVTGSSLYFELSCVFYQFLMCILSYYYCKHNWIPFSTQYYYTSYLLSALQA